jgi:hypothetical protein
MKITVVKVEKDFSTAGFYEVLINMCQIPQCHTKWFGTLLLLVQHFQSIAFENINSFFNTAIFHV